jgi:hypothetical protein
MPEYSMLPFLYYPTGLPRWGGWLGVLIQFKGLINLRLAFAGYVNQIILTG